MFPEPHRSTEFIDYEQMIDGLHHLESEHGDMLNVYSIGKSPGQYNYLSDRDDPKDLHVAEVTNDVNDEASFREKTKIHGLERAGAEAGSRFIEGILRGTETETEQLLDDLVLIFVYPNPDGWVAKYPELFVLSNATDHRPTEITVLTAGVGFSRPLSTLHPRPAGSAAISACTAVAESVILRHWSSDTL